MPKNRLSRQKSKQNLAFMPTKQKLGFQKNPASTPKTKIGFHAKIRLSRRKQKSAFMPKLGFYAENRLSCQNPAFMPKPGFYAKNRLSCQNPAFMPPQNKIFGFHAIKNWLSRHQNRLSCQSQNLWLSSHQKQALCHRTGFHAKTTLLIKDFHKKR